MNKTHIRDEFKWNSIKKFKLWKPTNMAVQPIWSILGTADWGKKIEHNFYFLKCVSICHSFSNLLPWLGGGSKPVTEVKYD